MPTIFEKDDNYEETSRIFCPIWFSCLLVDGFLPGLDDQLVLVTYPKRTALTTWPDSDLTRRNIEAQTEAKKLDGLQYKCMKRILRIRWPQTISHQQIQENTGVNSTSDEIRRRRWNWIGHIMRKDREEHCVTALEWRPEGRRRPGRPKATWRRIVAGKRKTAGCQSWSSGWK